ncbi:MAG: alpha/beta hydrolase [Flaviaesturariibacter sp.]|nr:alpha/beta hydrolase [Flaviaesturariibacter sp.]
MPLIILVIILADLLSVGFVLVDIWLWKEWDRYRDTLNNDYAIRCFYGAIALLLFIALGKAIIKALLSKRRKGEEEPRQVEPRKRETLVRPDGSHINIEHFGPEGGEPLVFVHGWNATLHEWYYQRKRFEKDRWLIFIDLPGLGKSTRPRNRDFSLSKMAGDLAAVIEHTGAVNPVLWGHSIGGMVILTLLAGKADGDTPRVKGIILEHTTYTNPVRTIIFSKLMTAIQKPVLEPICWILIALSPLVWISRWMSYLNGNSHVFTRLLTFTGTQTPRQLDFITRLSTMAPPAVTARGVLGMFRYDVTKDLPRINVPALVLAANKDRLTKPEASHYMATHLPSAQLVILAPGGHQGLVERHEEANAAASAFLGKLQS